MQKVFCDTNVLMQFSQEIFNTYDKVLICSYVLNELDKHKVSSDENKRFQARRAARDIEKYENTKVEYVIREGSYSLPLEFEINNPDNMIISLLKDMHTIDNKLVALSNDLLFRQKCRLLNIPCKKFEGNEVSGIYKGYRTLSGGTYFINELFEDVANGRNEHGFVTNEYLILFNSDTGKVSEHRYNGNKFVDLKLPDSKAIKGKNSLQRCALDLLNNKEISIVAINGTVGSGKTYLCIRMGLHHVNDKGNANKVLAIREALGEGKEVGYLKGTFEEKTEMFFKPIEHSLKNGEVELKYLIDQGVLESNIPFYLKGTTYHETIIVVDEAEDLSKKQLKLVGTRLGQNSRIFFAGDYKQSSIDSSERNALVQMCNEFKGMKEFGCIYLDEDIRSEASKMFANLFDK